MKIMCTQSFRGALRSTSTQHHKMLKDTKSVAGEPVVHEFQESVSVCLSSCAIAVRRSMTKATYNRNHLFGSLLIVSEG